ncbi:MAG: hypothetical protein IJF02_04660, partial [Oscillospiraceae bacterium]|nr:hypothetical protein [Oscillospiraceae bacterium]
MSKPTIKQMVGMGARRVIAVILAISMVLIPVNFSTTASAAERDLLTDDFTAAHTETRTTSLWDCGYVWNTVVGKNKEGDVTVADGKLTVTRGTGSSDPTFAYISAMDSAGALDYATQITNFTLETKFARFAPEGVTSGSAITP